MTIHLTKTHIRQVCLSQRKHLARQFVTQASQRIIDTIQDLQAYQTAKHIAWYHPSRGEVDLSLLWQNALTQNKCCYFPAIQPNNTLLFLPYTADTELVLNRYQITEPHKEGHEAIAPEDLDILFLPTVAFDANQNRLGMGKGYYDKTLENHPGPLLIGVAYEWQKQPNLPYDSWDIPLTMIITEERTYP
jgi:5-formyltetrahydrofolate cyclo-ligase